MYRYVAQSIQGFVQQLAVAYLSHGYLFYVTGEIPGGKDPAFVDRKLLTKYGIELSKRSGGGPAERGPGRPASTTFASAGSLS